MTRKIVKRWNKTDDWLWYGSWLSFAVSLISLLIFLGMDYIEGISILSAMLAVALMFLWMLHHVINAVMAAFGTMWRLVTQAAARLRRTRQTFA